MANFNKQTKWTTKILNASFGFLNENFTLNEIEELEKISLLTTAFKEDTCSVLNLEKALILGLWLWLLLLFYFTLIRYIQENIHTLVSGILNLQSEYFPVWNLTTGQ